MFMHTLPPLIALMIFLINCSSKLFLFKTSCTKRHFYTIICFLKVYYENRPLYFFLLISSKVPCRITTPSKMYLPLIKTVCPLSINLSATSSVSVNILKLKFKTYWSGLFHIESILHLGNHRDSPIIQSP